MFTKRLAHLGLAFGLLLLVAVTVSEAFTDRLRDDGTTAAPMASELNPDLFLPVPSKKGESVAPPPSSQPDDEAAGQSALRKLSNQEISRIRFLELRGTRSKTDRPDRVQARISNQVMEAFLAEMEGHEGFLKDIGGGESVSAKEARRIFYQLTLPQKLHVLAYYQGAKYADRVEILTDPEVFVSFKKNVQPVVVRACGRAGCHSAANEDSRMRFRLYNDPKRSAATTYANFIMLCEVRVGGRKLIDRAHVENSLLLTCMLPIKDVPLEFRHPPANVELSPVFRTSRAEGYQRISKWIASLKQPAEDYGVHFLKGNDEESADTSEDGSEIGGTPSPSGGEKPASNQPSGSKPSPADRQDGSTKS